MPAKAKRIRGKLYSIWLQEFWSKPKFRKCNLWIKSVYWFLGTNPCGNMVGFYSIDEDTIKFRTRVPLKRFFYLMSRLPKDVVFKERDSNDSEVWWIFIPATMELQVKGEKQIIGAKRLLEEMPDRVKLKWSVVIPFFNDIVERLGYPIHTLSKK